MNPGEEPLARPRVQPPALGNGSLPPERPEQPERNGSADADELDEVRRLLLGPEQQRLERLEDRGLDAKELADVLGPAVRMSSARDDQLSKALAPTIETSIQHSVRRNPKALADAIFPSLGPAIRKSIRHSLSTMIESFNQILENTFSVRGLKWRLEAYRTGRPFSEVALMHSLVYRVEQVFLIHREDGLLLQHVVAPAVPAQDADMVTAMLTAIRQFARDSFPGSAGEAGGQLPLGEQRLVIADGPEAILAALVRGIPPLDLQERIEERLAEVHSTCADELAEYDGDDVAFEPARPLLEELLEQKVREHQRKTRVSAPLAGVAVVLVLLVILAARAFFASRAQETEFQSLVERVSAEPGLFVVESRRDGDEVWISGLRDPAARDPEQVAADASIDKIIVHWSWQTFHSMEPGMVLARIESALMPPSGVVLVLDDGVLELHGAAPEAWLEQVRTLAPALGARWVDESGLAAVDGE
ncbi:MAG: hypothetical protein AAF682_00800 [Planctomycetota bacterium]